MSENLPYAGDLEPKDAWKLLEENPQAVLVDVRSRVEWALVGVPDTSDLNTEPVFVEWQTLQGQNPAFKDQLLEELSSRNVDKDTPVLFMCRSGGRSAMAATDLAGEGYTASYNIAHGFEGELDDNAHRNSVSGWRKDGLPWGQS